MKKAIISLSVVTAMVFSTAALAAKPGSEPPQPEPQGYRFLGFSTATVHGGVGLRGMNQACQNTYPSAAGVRMCKSSEILDTAVLPIQPNGGWGWVHPTIVELEIDTSVTGYKTRPLDASGVLGRSDGLLSCNAWRSAASNTRGLAVDGTGFWLAEANCNGTNYVACCSIQ